MKRSSCGLLLDLHNLYVNAVNHGFDAFEFIDELALYTDSHAGACHPVVWALLDYLVPRAPNLLGVTFEFHDSYFLRRFEEGSPGRLNPLVRVARFSCDANALFAALARGEPTTGVAADRESFVLSNVLRDATPERLPLDPDLGRVLWELQGPGVLRADEAQRQMLGELGLIVAGD